ncbi:MAG: hypothetical protein JG780_40 [Thermosipho sp. (in: Bacteria)]|nr:hypothetical protein [Thermosipho sp. (in: thermotogales)]
MLKSKFIKGGELQLEVKILNKLGCSLAINKKKGGMYLLKTGVNKVELNDFVSEEIEALKANNIIVIKEIPKIEYNSSKEDNSEENAIVYGSIIEDSSDKKNKKIKK